MLKRSRLPHIRESVQFDDGRNPFLGTFEGEAARGARPASRPRPALEMLVAAVLSLAIGFAGMALLAYGMERQARAVCHAQGCDQ